MAKKVKTKAKTAMKPKRSTKTTKISRSKKFKPASRSLFGRLGSFKTALFVLLFAAVGGIVIWRLQAQGPYLTGADEIIFQHTKQAAAATVTLDDPVGSQRILMQLTGDGTLVCHDGTEVTLNRGRMTSANIAKLFESVSQQNPEGIADPNLDSRPTVLREEWEILLIGYREGAHIIPSHNSAGEEVIGFRTIVNRLNKECEKATEKVHRRDLRQPREPNFRSESAATGLRKLFGNLFNPKVSATHKTSHGGGSGGSGGGRKSDTEVLSSTAGFQDYEETQMNNLHNNHRVNADRVAAVTVSSCLKAAAQRQAQDMANAGYIFHSDVAARLYEYCNQAGLDYAWSGEIVGRGSTTQAIFDAYIASAGHHDVIHRNPATYFATGTYKTSNGTLYTASLFVDCTNFSTCASKFSGAPAPAPTPTDSYSCTGISGAPTSITAGQSFTASFTVKNTGTTQWTLGTTSGTWRLGSSNYQNNTTWNTSRVNGSGTVAPGATGTFSGTFTAPSTANTYTFNWEMLKENAYWLSGSACQHTITVAAAYTPPPPPPPTTNNDRLGLGESLAKDQYRTSYNGSHKITMQPDGNLVTRYVPTGGVVWHSNTWNGGSGTYAVFQSGDGNFVIYKGTGGYCHSATYGRGGSYMKIQDDGNFVMYTSGGSAIWSTRYNALYCS